MNQSVAIIGFGRFGQVLAELLQPECRILAYDITEITHVAATHGVRSVSLQEAAAADTIFISVPIRHFKEVVVELVPHLKPGTTIIDVCSVKVYPATVMKEHLPAGVRAIATHPLFGPDSSRKGFNGLPMAMHPVTPRDDIFDQWSSHFKSKGIAIKEMTPEEHDRMAARSQGVTHFMGRVLQKYGITPTGIDTEGFIDLQLVVEQTCHDSIELFHDLERYNPYTLDMIQELNNALEEVKTDIFRR